MALSRIERNWKFSNDMLPVYYLDLLSYPTISSKIAEQFNVQHESPQLLIIKNGVCIYTASHYAINIAEIESAMG